MSNFSFSFIDKNNEDIKHFQSLRLKHIQELRHFDDNFYISRVLAFLSGTCNKILNADRKTLRECSETEITDSIRNNLRDCEKFCFEGFLVDSEARNQHQQTGYYDLKFQNSYWSNYLSVECKLLDQTNPKLNAYIFNRRNGNIPDGGLYRFLINKYSSNLPFGCMMGYIIDGKPQHIISDLQIKMQQFSQKTECGNEFGNLIESIQENTIEGFQYSMQSKHIRSDENMIINPIDMLHVFINFTN